MAREAEVKKKALIHELYSLGAVRFGSFTLKSGVVSPIYVDLRLTISRPDLLIAIGEELFRAAGSSSFELLCGVPYTAIPFATAISIQHKIPMLLKRKERKEYGTKKMVEGIFQKGQTCLLVEDVVTSGASVDETALSLQEEGLSVKDAVVLVNRGQGAEKLLAEKQIRLHSVLTLSEILEELLAQKLIDKQTVDETFHFIQTHQSSS